MRSSRRTGFFVGGAGLSLTALAWATRRGVPTLLRSQLEKKLNSIPGYEGHIDSMAIRAREGLVEVGGLTFDVVAPKESMPLVRCSEVAVKLHWPSLMRRKRHITGHLVKPEVTLVGKHEELADTDPSSRRRRMEMLRESLPSLVSSIEVRQGRVHFLRIGGKDELEFHLDDIAATLTALASGSTAPQEEVLRLDLKALTTGQGRLVLQIDLKPQVSPPEFTLKASLQGLALETLNPFLRESAGFDVTQGGLNLIAEVTARDGRYEGFMTARFQDVEVYGEDDREEGFWQRLKERLVEGVKDFLEDEHRRWEQKAELSDYFENPDEPAWVAAGQVLGKLFLAAMSPRQTILGRWSG